MGRIRALLVVLLLAIPSVGSAIVLGQVDDFENGTTMGWDEGFVSPNPPVNVSTGGPAGAGDNYLRNVSSGVFGAGGKMVQFNQVQWTGNYNAAGVATIEMSLANFGTTDLHLRLAIDGASTQYGSTLAYHIPPDGQWYRRTFALTAGSMTLVGGLAPLSTVLSSVATLRIVSRESGPGWQGDEVAATLGVDNIRAGSVAAVGSDAPAVVRILPAAPNPFSFSTVIRYELPRALPVQVTVLDAAGRRVRLLVPSSERPAGLHEVIFDGRDGAGRPLPGGVYFIRIEAPGLQRTGRVHLAR